MKTGCEELATCLAEVMEMQAKKASTEDVADKNRVFDLVMNMNTLDQEKADMEKLVEEGDKDEDEEEEES